VLKIPKSQLSPIKSKNFGEIGPELRRKSMKKKKKPFTIKTIKIMSPIPDPVENFLEVAAKQPELIMSPIPGAIENFLEVVSQEPVEAKKDSPKQAIKRVTSPVMHIKSQAKIPVIKNLPRLEQKDSESELKVSPDRPVVKSALPKVSKETSKANTAKSIKCLGSTEAVSAKKSIPKSSAISGELTSPLKSTDLEIAPIEGLLPEVEDEFMKEIVAT
jgi:hypothetical protein